jgi:hypothetical protein
MFKLNLFFVGSLKVNGENDRIRIRIRIHESEAWIRGSGSGSTPKCHGSATLPVCELYLTSLWIDDLVHLCYVVALLVPLAGVLPVRVVQVQPTWTNLQPVFGT